MFATAFLAIGAQHSVGHLWSRRHQGRCRASMELEGGGPQAKWLKHLQIFDFWRARLHKDGLQTLGGIAATGTSEAARVAAAIALLDRGRGRPSAVAHRLRQRRLLTVEIVHRPRCLDRRRRSWSNTSTSNPQTVATTAADRVADERMRLLASKLAAL